MIALCGEVLTGRASIPDGVVLIDGEQVVAIGSAAEVSIPPGADRALAAYVAPGYVELQLNGAFGHDFHADPASAAKVAALLPATGVTSFLPTLISSSRAALEPKLAALRSIRTAPGAARSLGVHLEGPWLSPRRVGAHDPGALELPPRSADSISNAVEIDKPVGACADWLVAAGVRLVTLAPELSGALDLARALIDRGVVVSAGHTDATVEQAQAAIAAGIHLCTHLFNAMPALHHRAPGAAGAYLAAAGPAVGLIADGVHVHPAMVEVVRRCKAVGKVVLVTDAMAAAGMPAGRSMLAGREVIVDHTSARLPDGTLAGSTLTLDAAVRNYRKFTNCDAAEAVAAATLAPALALGDARLGRLFVGGPADALLLDRDLFVQAAFIAGARAASRSAPARGPRAAP